MTYEQALRHLDKVYNYLNNLLDTGHRLSNGEIEELKSERFHIQSALAPTGV